MAVKIDLGKKKVSLGVGDLVAEPLANAGRGSGLRAMTRLTLGREAHVRYQDAQAELHEGYAREIFVRYTTVVDDFTVKIQGRIDGVYRPPVQGNGAEGQWIIEEIKSVVLPPLTFAALDADSRPHYVEQLRLYCFFVEKEGLQEGKPAAASGRLVYVNVTDGTRKDIEVLGPFDDCEAMVAARVRVLIGNALEEERRLAQRRGLADGLAFPHNAPRKHQDQMIAAVEKALGEGRHLLVSAPSGIGKTAGALFPTVGYALANNKRVFFVTAKNTQQQIAWDTLGKMGGKEASVPTAVMFRARETMCINDVYACHEEFCPHLKDFKAKLEQTRVVDRLLGKRLVAPDAMMAAGLQARLCPFELALLEAEMTDVIVCDYNYVFDPQVYFRRFFQDEDYSNAVLVIDEAHNLVQRAMDYYSPILHRRQVKDLMTNLRHVEPSLAEELTDFLREIDKFFRRTAKERPADDPEATRSVDTSKFLIDSPRPFFDELKPTFNRLSVRYILSKISNGRAIPDDPVEQFFSDLGQFCNVLAMEGEEFSYVFDETEDQAIKIICKDPSKQLAERLEGFQSVIAMSATLAPMEFYERMLGFDPERTDRLSLPSPFPRENRKIIVVPNVSTTFRYRASNYRKIADIIATTSQARRGNYMALFPSYDFMRSVAEELPEGNWMLKVQQSRMTDIQRQELLDSLKELSPPKLVLAVQGGLFAEGVDYPGELLSGVIVVSPALPQVSFERELMRFYYQERHGKGFEFAYLYPGMNRVIQSVGRLIRNETDCGVAVLVCQRFAQAQYSTLFPPDWSDLEEPTVAGSSLSAELRRFWSRIEEKR
jgi:DNA excision repair protein ERCC-2